jgi:amino acid adenylation domain-containing protein
MTRAEIESSIAARFEHIVDRFETHVALRGAGQAWTYGDLNLRANRIANAIRSATQPGTGCVAFLADHAPAMAAAILGIVKAGKAYLALHPAMPADAQRAILADAAPELLLATAGLRAHARDLSTAVEVLDLDAIQECGPSDNAPPAAGPDDVSTIFYTSGSTGRPKGVHKSHRAVLHRVWLAGQYDRVSHADRQSLLTYPSFSAAEADIFGALLHGATLCLFDAATRGLAELGPWIEVEGITLLHPPVLYFRRFLSTLEGSGLFPSVRLVTLAGDVVRPTDVERWRRHFSPACALMHRFSTTETALVAVSRIDAGTPIDLGRLPAGRPVADKRLEVIDAEGNPAEPGEEGELVVTSAYLAGGYWRQPEASATAFRLHPHEPDLRTYRTGDVGRLLADGSFEFLGRRDHQVKIRGYRVELREVEAALLDLPAVGETAAIAEEVEGEPRLTAFVVMKPSYAFDPEEIRAHLGRRLPPWKIPAGLHALPSLPTTYTGKLDRPRLLAAAREHSAEVPPADAGIADPAAGAECSAPNSRTPLEQALADCWRSLLGVARIDVHSSFFDLGGDSLAAIRLCDWIAQHTGQRLTAAALHGAPTIARLAALLEQPASAGVETGVVLLRPGHGRPPLFVLHSMGGEVFYARPIAGHLTGDLPVYGIRQQAPDGKPFLADSFEALAARCVNSMIALLPEGPFRLAGYSFGGLLAYEAARQLAARGCRVELVAVVDALPSSRTRAPANAPKSVAAFARNLSYWIADDLMHSSPRALAARVRRALTGRGPLPPARHDLAAHLKDSPLAQWYHDIIAANGRLLARYDPQLYPGRLLLIRTRAEGPRALRAEDRGWGLLAAGGVEVRTVKANHITIVKEPHARTVAALLAAELDRLDA